MFAFLLGHKVLLATGAYIGVGVFVLWFVGEMRRIDNEKVSLGYRYGYSSDARFAVYKCFVLIAGVLLWPFLLRSRWGEMRQSKRKVGSLPADKDHRAVETRPEDWHRGQTLLVDFKVERELGEGGMGKVYLVTSQTTNMRFAVKRAKGLSEGARRKFLTELQTWIDLPEHVNLVPCRFFRTVGEEVLIFAEYVEGGSLKDWIESRKLYEGGAEKTLERILETAIQFAWGLHCLHEVGLVHQDVKPANVMMDIVDAQGAVRGLRARITDYGLAGARAAGETRDAQQVGRSVLVSSGGNTPAYCSPEQADGRKVDRRTDVWSWGVSVLEMFQGEVTWQSGRVATEALEAFLERNNEGQGIPAMPEGVAEILRGCFREDPATRWESLESVVQKLKGVYRVATGAEYSGALGKIENRVAPQVGPRHTRQGLAWRDPRDWLRRALQAEGRDPAEAAKIVAGHATSRRGQLASDMAVFDEGRRIYERLIKNGRADLEYELSSLCLNAAGVHETADDFPGAFALYDRAIESYRRLIKVGGRRELADSLAMVCGQKANVLMNLGDNKAAVGLFDGAIKIWEALVNFEGRHELAGSLAGIYASKAAALMNLGDNGTAVCLYDRAIEIFDRLVNKEGQREFADNLAGLYMNKGAAVVGLGDDRTALELFDRAIEIRERLVDVEGRRELANGLANFYRNKGLAVSKLGDNCAAVSLFDRAIEISETLVNVEGRRELANDLAGHYMSKATALGALGDNQAAVVFFDRAIGIRERLVNVEGRRDLANNLATLYINKAKSVLDLGDQRAGVTLCDRAIEILERLVNVEGRGELADNLAMVFMNKANAFMILGDNRAAVAPYDRAIEINERLVNVESRSELALNLATLYRNKGNAVKNLENHRAAVSLYDRAIAIFDRLVNVEGRRDLAEDFAVVRRLKSIAISESSSPINVLSKNTDVLEQQLKSERDNHRKKNDVLTEQLTSSLSDLLLGGKIPVDVVNIKTGEIIIPANRKITRTLLRKVAMAHDHIDIEPGPTHDKIREIIQSYEHKFAGLKREEVNGIGLAGLNAVSDEKRSTAPVLRHETDLAGTTHSVEIPDGATPEQLRNMIDLIDKNLRLPEADRARIKDELALKLDTYKSGRAAECLAGAIHPPGAAEFPKLITFKHKGRQHTVRLCHASSTPTIEVDGVVKKGIHMTFAAGYDASNAFDAEMLIGLAKDYIDPGWDALTADDIAALCKADDSVV